MRISVVLDCSKPDELVSFWEAALGYQMAKSLDGYRVLVPADGEPAGPALILQPVPEPRPGKNRVHIDVHPADPPAHIARLEKLGGQKLWHRIDAFGVWWQAMTDPEGNEFCVVADAQGPGGN
jgi:predicted enzyme related to lactoylglutathione lyase